MSEKWDRFYLELAKFTATKLSKDPSTQVGAVVVNWDAHKEFIGYNGFPRGVADLPERYADRAIKYPFMVHAELNAILKAADLARGASLYVWPSFAHPNVCQECAKAAIQSGIREIVGYGADASDPRNARWMQSIEFAKTMLTEAGLPWRVIDE